MHSCETLRDLRAKLTRQLVIIHLQGRGSRSWKLDKRMVRGWRWLTASFAGRVLLVLLVLLAWLFWWPAMPDTETISCRRHPP